MFRPPVDRSMRVLDRSFFQKTVKLAAARVFDNSQIPNLRASLKADLISAPGIPGVQECPWDRNAQPPAKALVLRPGISADEPTTWPERLRELADRGQVDIGPFSLHLGYDYWNHGDIISSTLPEHLEKDWPSGFAAVGHVAHLNLRNGCLPWKKLIGQVILDKNPTIRTVINKTEDVGAKDQFRTFQYEILAGEPRLNVEAKTLGCTFAFDFSKVYWNGRLETERSRLLSIFKPGEAICDVMAGVGPFSVPAGKKKIFAWANDLNPHCFAGLKDAIRRNKVGHFVLPFNEDGRSFIQNSANRLMSDSRTVDVTPRLSRSAAAALNQKEGQEQPPRQMMRQPKVFSHYIMNLPASAIDFLDAFIGLYSGREELFSAAANELPLIHVYCFSPITEDEEREKEEVCRRISERLDFEIKLGDPDLEIFDVRNVSPKKRYYCVTFRLPREVAIRKPKGEKQEGVSNS